MGHSREVLRLPSNHLDRGGVPCRVDLLQDMGRIADGGQRISQLVADHGHELVLAVVRLLRGLEGVPELPSRRRELGERPDDPLILPVELPLVGVTHDPHRPHGPAANPERDEHGLDEPGLRPQSGKVAIRQMHQLGHVLVDAHAARAGRPGHRTVAVGGAHAGHRFPSKDVPFEQADPGRVGSAQLSSRFDEPLEHAAGVLGHLPGEYRQRPVQAFGVGQPRPACRKLGADIDLRQGGGGLSQLFRTSHRARTHPRRLQTMHPGYALRPGENCPAGDRRRPSRAAER